MEKVILNLNSNNGVTPVGLGSEYKIVLQPPNNSNRYFQVLSAEIPFSFYAVNGYNNQFRITTLAPAHTLDVTILAGNYTTGSLATAILQYAQVILDKTGGTTYTGINGAGSGYTWTMAIVDAVNDPQGVRGAYTLASATGAFQITAGPTNSADKVLGLAYSTDPAVLPPTGSQRPQTSTLIGGSNNLYFPYVANAAGTPYIFLQCLELSSGYNYANNTLQSVLIKIPVPTGSGGNIFYIQRLTSEWTEFCLAPLQDYSTLNLGLLDSQLNPINLNGQDWSCTIGFSKTDN